MTLTAIICTYNRHDLLADAVGSLISQHDGTDFEILVVDNSSNVSLAAHFARQFSAMPFIRFMHVPLANLSNARNEGARAASTDLVAYLDDDAMAGPHWVKALLQAFEVMGPNVAVLGGPIRPVWPHAAPPWLSPRALDMLSIVDRGPTRRILEPHEWLAGCNIAFRRDRLLAVGGFPLDLGRSGSSVSLMANEEYLVCERLMKAGFLVAYTPEAYVDHRIDARRMSVRWLTRRMAWQAISDAISHSERSSTHAAWTSSRFNKITTVKRRLIFFWIMSRYKRSLGDDDLNIVYDEINRMICL